jgi:hypothetical protein
LKVHTVEGGDHGLKGPGGAKAQHEVWEGLGSALEDFMEQQVLLRATLGGEGATGAVKSAPTAGAAKPAPTAEAAQAILSGKAVADGASGGGRRAQGKRQQQQQQQQPEQEVATDGQGREGALRRNNEGSKRGRKRKGDEEGVVKGLGKGSGRKSKSRASDPSKDGGLKRAKREQQE